MDACMICEKLLPNLREAYGSIYQPVCVECELLMDEEMSQPSYGRFVGGDPRKFQPDIELCTPEEIALHTEHCAMWDRGERITVPIHGHSTIEGKSALIEYANYGIGINNVF